MAKFTPGEWRRAKKLSLEETAKVLGISAPTLRKWENQPSLFTVDAADKFCKLIGEPQEAVIFLP